MEKMEKKLKHLELIQGVVNRLAEDSFRIKGWTVILISALLVLLAREGGRFDFAPIGLVPILIFWGLDGYFLQQERLFRDLYDHIRTLNEDDIDFSMDTSAFGQTWCKAMRSVTLVPFYIALALSVGIAMFIS